MPLWVYECNEKHICKTCDGSGSVEVDQIDDVFDMPCVDCNGTGEYGDAKIERLERGKRRRPNPYCHLCGKKMKWVKYPGSNFELKGNGWSK